MGKRVDFKSMAADEPYEPASRKNNGALGGTAELPIDQIAANPLNQRSESDEDPEEFEQLTATVREHGLLQPLVVVTVAEFERRYPDQAEAVAGARWVALIGNRRLAAARAAARDRVPAVVNDERVESMFEVMLVENSHRRDLAPLREAEAMRQVLDREGISRAELARRIGRTGGYITQRLGLLNLIPALREALESGILPLELARDFGGREVEEQEAIAAAGPPKWTPGRLYGVKPPRGRASKRSLPAGDPAAAAKSIRELYRGEELAELIRLLGELESS